MKITMPIANLNKALDSFKVILNDALLADDKRNIILWKKEDGVKLVAKNDIIDCICDIEATSVVDGSVNEMQSIKYKELQGVLDGFKSLRVTQATNISFEFLENFIAVEVEEEPIDKDSDYAEKLFRTNKYQLSRSKPVSDVQRNEILAVSLSDEGTLVSKDDIVPYFSSLLPTVKDMREGVPTRFNVVGDYIYTTPMSFAALMYNTVPEFKDFILTSSAANFMKSFFELEDKTNINIEAINENAKIVRLSNSMAMAVVKTISTKKAFNVANYIELPSTGVAVDKGYFCDVIKRFTNNAEAIKITVKPEEITLKQSRVTMSVPVYTARLDDTFTEMTFSVNANVLSNLVFAHANFSNLLFIYFKKVGNKWAVSFTDDSFVNDADGNKKHVWWTGANFKDNR